MCGFVGKVNFEKNNLIHKSEILEMTNCLFHRGPDSGDTYIQNNIGMGFRRLSIIDLENGNQPMKSNDKNIIITFNGEIYNFKNLKQKLLSKGYNFNTNSDTEVIINLYIEYGESCLKYLRGMFAFVIFDRRKNKLFGARDRLGIKPFYYLLDKDKFIWSSELKGIKMSKNINLTINNDSIDQYLTYGYICGKNCIYNEVEKLEPGTFFSLMIDNNSSFKTKKYWSLDFQPDYSKSKDDYIELLKSELDESVKIRMISDVPLGAFLSGGIDSSSVVALMNNHSSSQIKTFSIGFEDKKFNELIYARELSKKYDTDHHELIVKPESISLLPKLVESYDEPFADSSAIPTYYVSKFSREYVKVCLSGDGGDELFAGYNSYSKMLKFKNRPLNNKLINSFMGLLFKITPNNFDVKRLLHYFSLDSSKIGAFLGIFKQYERNRLYNDSFKSLINQYSAEDYKLNLLTNYSSDFISNMQNLDIDTYLVDDILTKVDRASMMNSLEVRVPFLDHKVVELASKIPVEYKINQYQKKIILKDAMKKYIPKSIIEHPKQGFAVPISNWFKDDLFEFINDELLSNSAEIFNFFNKREIYRLIASHKKNYQNNSEKIWSLLFLEQWLKLEKK